MFKKNDFEHDVWRNDDYFRIKKNGIQFTKMNGNKQFDTNDDTCSMASGMSEKIEMPNMLMQRYHKEKPRLFNHLKKAGKGLVRRLSKKRDQVGMSRAAMAVIEHEKTIAPPIPKRSPQRKYDFYPGDEMTVDEQLDEMMRMLTCN